ncbi:MAG: T9SS type A sorting domain-containing protein [Muribaculaceae bacterium]|nr:T9SS type A sorting domain-containing protein [Muribaculaceae bacterium]
MKKTFLFLSALTLAATAGAADRLVPGTTNNPNYYVFMAGRGAPWLALSDANLTTPNGGSTNLLRTKTLTEANIWAVTPGSTDETVRITAYGSSKGLMSFVNSTDGSASYNKGAIAVADKAQDIYLSYYHTVTDPSENTLSVCLSLFNAIGYEAISSDSWLYYSLDASNNSDFCGNWFAGETGTIWSAYKLDLSSGTEKALQNLIETEGNKLRELKINDLKAFKESIPGVDAILNDGIKALEKITLDANFSDAILRIYDSTINAANLRLQQTLANKKIALKNLRRQDYGVQSYLSNYPILNGFSTTYSIIDEATWFTFVPNGNGGFRLYHEASNTWLGESCSPTTESSKAAIIYPSLLAMGAYQRYYRGAALSIGQQYGLTGLNYQSWLYGSLSAYTVYDDGSIWALVDVEQTDKYADAVNAYTAQLEPYIDNVPPQAADVLRTAVANIKQLPHDDNFSTDILATFVSAQLSVKDILANNLGGQEWNIKSLPCDKYIAVNNSVCSYTDDNASAATAFSFISKPNGGYILYNKEADAYLSGHHDYTQKNLRFTSNESEALIVYPIMLRGVSYTDGPFFGVGLSLTSEYLTTGTTASLKSYDEGVTYGASTINSTFEAASIYAIRTAGSAKLAAVSSEPINIEIDNNGIIVNNAPDGSPITVYDLSGRTVCHTAALNSKTPIALTRGIYVVEISGSTIAKILIR